MGPGENAASTPSVEPKRSAQATPRDPCQPERRAEQAEVQDVPDGETVPVGKALRTAELTWKVQHELGRSIPTGRDAVHSPPIGPRAVVCRCQ